VTALSRRGEIGTNLDEAASVIYGDVRFKPPNSCRLLKCDYVDNTGQPHVNHYAAPKIWLGCTPTRYEAVLLS
jgi:hypothetical protein